MYENAKNPDGSIDETTIIRQSDKAHIPVDPENRDYQQYLEWAASQTDET